MSEKPRTPKSQLELGIQRPLEPDRNLSKGGRSFYFFDLDDNVFILKTKIFVFEKNTREEISFSTSEFAKIHPLIGRPGPYENYEVDFNDEVGSFRRFRGTDCFIEDIHEAIDLGDLHWKGPSWDFFYHAVYNQRPISIITARGHSTETLKEGIEVFVKKGILPKSPNYLSVFAVSHKDSQVELGDEEFTWSIAELKKAAIIHSVQAAMENYGLNPAHRFGMSDDDPKNIELGIQAMREMKKQHPENSFFMFSTDKGKPVRHEIHVDRVDEVGYQQDMFKHRQLELF